MPTKRKRTSRTARAPLIASERHLLLTGECTPPRGCWRDYGEKVFRTFQLVAPGDRDELRALWLRHRHELLNQWRERQRRGLP